MMKSKAINRSRNINTNMVEKRGFVKVDSIIYDEDLDILELYTNEDTHHCLEIDDLIIVHCDKKNKIIGLEIMGISNIYNIPKKILNNLKSAKFIVKSIPNEEKIFITTELKSIINGNNQMSTNLLATPPLGSPLVCNC